MAITVGDPVSERGAAWGAALFGASELSKLDKVLKEVHACLFSRFLLTPGFIGFCCEDPTKKASRGNNIETNQQADKKGTKTGRKLGPKEVKEQHPSKPPRKHKKTNRKKARKEGTNKPRNEGHETW